MSNYTLATLLNTGGYSQTQLGTALASSTSLTDISPGAATAGQAFTFPANYLQTGQQYTVRAKGIVSNTGTPTLLLGLYYGAAAGVALATTGTATTASSLSNSIWSLEADLRVDGVGTSGAIRTLGSVNGPYSGSVMLPAAGSSSGNSVTVDTSTAKALTLAAQWSASSASNSIQCVTFQVIKWNDGGTQ